MLGGSTNDLSMKILELASRNEVLARRMEEAKSLEELVQLLNENGFDVTAEELEAAASPNAGVELSEDELDAVAGGDHCFCVAGSGGEDGEHEDVYHRGTKAKEKTCVCVGVGLASSDTDPFRCFCIIIGTGDKSSRSKTSQDRGAARNELHPRIWTEK
ncbi:MAG: Nif11-like leader peptide family RiPP precursor [Atopobiaceae bacterium]|nr:Nif11-like leader peptide family RiPP precursor [Atopobiaceae bacterium]